MDEDLQHLTPGELLAEERRLRVGIRAHRDASGHELCWHQPALWGLLPERTDPARLRRMAMDPAALAAVRRRRHRGRAVVLVLSLLGAGLVVSHRWIVEHLLDWQATGIGDPVQLVGTWRLVGDDYDLTADERREIATLVFSVEGEPRPPVGHVASWPAGRGVLETASGRWPFTLRVMNRLEWLTEGPAGVPPFPRAPQGFWVMGSFHPTFDTLDRLSIDLATEPGQPLSSGSKRLRFDRL